MNSSLLTACRQLGIQTGRLERYVDYTLPNLDLRVDIEMGRLLFSGREEQPFRIDDDGKVCANVYHADATVHNLAEILTVDLKSHDAISFLKKFRTAQRIGSPATVSRFSLLNPSSTNVIER